MNSTNASQGGTVYSPVTLGTLVREVTAPGFVVAESRHDAGLVLGRHAHEYASLMLTVSGGVIERVGSAVFECGEMSVMFKPPGVEHSNQYRCQSHSVIVQVMPEQWEQVSIFISTPPALLRTGGIPYVRMLQLVGCLVSGARDDIRAEHLLLEMLAPEQPSRPSGPRDHRRMDTIAECIRERIERPPRLSELAHRFDYHPTALARAFRRHHGVSIGQFIHRCRVARAVELVARSSESISCIAARLGFSDQSHLARILNRTAAIAPGRLRELARSPFDVRAHRPAVRDLPSSARR